MTTRGRPGVLVVDSDRARSTWVARILAEAGIAVCVAPDREAALAAAARRRYDLAIVGADPAGTADGGGLAAAIRARQPALDIFPMAEVPLGLGEPRRLVGRVRERLLCTGRPPGQARDGSNAGEAERMIAAAKLACLYRRRQAAHAAGLPAFAEGLRREIAEAAAGAAAR